MEIDVKRDRRRKLKEGFGKTFCPLRVTLFSKDFIDQLAQ